MRPGSTEYRRKQRREAVWGVVINCVQQMVAAAVILYIRTLPSVDGWVDTVLLVAAALSLVLIGPSFAVLFQRLREIEGGEEEDAKRY